MRFDSANHNNGAPSPFRIRYGGELDFESMIAHYKGKRKDPDRLIWDRFHPVLDVQDVPHAMVDRLLRDRVFRVPHDCTIIFIDEYVSLCKCNEGYARWGTVHIGNQPVGRGRAKSHVTDILTDLGYRDFDDPQMVAMLSDICHGDHYMITDEQISMVVPRSDGRCMHLSKATLAPFRVSPWETRIEVRAVTGVKSAGDEAPREGRRPLLRAPAGIKKPAQP